MQSAGLGGGGERGDGGRGHDGGQEELERLMGQMAQLRDHGGGLGDETRRERAAGLALEAARLCGFDSGADDSDGAADD
jgi:hypothetical protein